MISYGVGGKLRGCFSIFSAKTALAALFILTAALASCGEAPNNTTSSSGDASAAQLNLSWPEGYSYDPVTKEIFLPTSERQASAQVYVTRITLTITGDGMKPLVLNVPLDTLTVEFIIAPGVRTFTISVETDLPGLSFSGVYSMNLKAGGIGDINFSLDLNAPPQNVAIKASKTTVSKNEKVTITLSAEELDPEDNPTVTWDAGGGVTAREGASDARTLSWSITWWAGKKGTYTVCGTIDDGKGGVGRACVSITVKDSAPRISGVTSSEYNPIKGGAVTLTCSASDPDGDRLYYNWSDGLGWTAAGATAQYTFGVSGDVKFTCAVSDGANTSYGYLTLNARLRMNGTVPLDSWGDSWKLYGITSGDNLQLTCTASTLGVYGSNLDVVVWDDNPDGCGGSKVVEDPDLVDTEPASTLQWTATQSLYCLDISETCNGGCDDAGYDCYLKSVHPVTTTQIVDSVP